MTPAEYMSALLKGNATVPGAMATLGAGAPTPPMGKGGQPPAAAVAGGTSAPPTPAQTPTATNFGDNNPDQAAAMKVLLGAGPLNGPISLTDPAMLAAAGKFPGAVQMDANGTPYLDPRALPKRADNTYIGQVNDQGHAIDTSFDPNSQGIRSGLFSAADPSAIWKDPIYGMTTAGGNVNINEALNNAQQTKDSGLFGQIGNALIPKSPLAVLLMAAGGAASAAGVPAWMSALGKTGINMAAQKIGS